MLTIRDPQLEAFESARYARFEARAVRYVCETPPAAEAAEALPLVRAAWAMAERYGVASEYDVLRLVGLCKIFGPTFDADPARPWVGPLLADAGLRAEQRVQTLWERLRAET